MGNAAPGKCDAAIAPDGSVVFAAVSGTGPWGVEVRRSTLPWTSWPDFVAVSGDANVLAGVCVAVAGSTVRLLWQSAASTAVLYADSVDDGVSWGTPATLFNPGHTVYGIACVGDLNTVVIAYDVLGLGSQRLALWRYSGSGVLPTGRMATW